MSIYQFAVKAADTRPNQVRNIHHYEFPGYVATTPQLQQAVERITAHYLGNLQGDIHSSYTFYGIDVRRVDIGDQPTIGFVPAAGSWSGTATGDPLPPQVSALVTFKALTAFPRTTRTYLWGAAEGANGTIGAIASAYRASIEAWADDMLSLLITDADDAVKVAVQYGGDPRVVVASNQVTQWSLTDIWATQRRRRYGVGI